MKTTEGKCTNEWCSKFCESKSEGNKFEAQCDEHQTCKCQYAKQTFIKASGGRDHQREARESKLFSKKFL